MSKETSRVHHMMVLRLHQDVRWHLTREVLLFGMRYNKPFCLYPVCDHSYHTQSRSASWSVQMTFGVHVSDVLVVETLCSGTLRRAKRSTSYLDLVASTSCIIIKVSASSCELMHGRAEHSKLVFTLFLVAVTNCCLVLNRLICMWTSNIVRESFVLLLTRNICLSFIGVVSSTLKDFIAFVLPLRRSIVPSLSEPSTV